MNKLDAFIKLATLFSEHGYHLYLVGGSVRDYLLKGDIDDLDVCADATPNDVKSFYSGEATYAFEKMGAVTLKYEGYRFDLTTLREEGDYVDFRHPSFIHFVKDLKVDVRRRDFTVNALYLDKDLNVLDYVDGQKDLSNKIIRVIGDPNTRLKEDPLRILRALRFSLDFNFKIEESLEKAMKENIELLKKLNVEKIKQELKKIKVKDERMIELFNNFNISYLLDVIK